MSTSFELTLPTDIPWRRKCVSKDMLDPKLCDQQKLYRWRSSIAVFEFEPDEENQLYEGMLISYLKVACTITGYQEDPKEIGLNIRGAKSYWHNSRGIENYLEALQKYYPCYGAILEVAVGPENEEGTPLDKYPYFLDFEPKKRELFEVVTETGETLSRSLSNIELGKSTTTINQHEVVDIDKGWAASAQVKTKGVEVGASGSRQGEWGSRDIAKNEVADVRNSDASQESRETLSHTTQLTQMYHQLNSYHVGTNRAVFFVLPRPHIMESEHTFVNGPRIIEGIQEFFLVVARPKDMQRICVEAYLETGHIGKIPHWVTEEVPGTELHTTWSDAFHAQPIGNDDETPVYDDKDRIWNVNSHNPGYKIKSVAFSAGPVNGKPHLVDIHPHISEQNEDLIRVSGKVHSSFKNYVVGEDRWDEIHYPFQATIALVKKQAIQKTEDTLFLTGRRLCCCRERPFHTKRESGITYEKPLPKVERDPPRPGASVSIREANQLTAELREALISSRVDRENRYDSYKTLASTEFAVRSIVEALEDDRINPRMGDQENIPQSIREKLRDLNPDVTVREMLSMPYKMMHDLFGLTEDESAELKTTLTGVSNTSYELGRAWLNDRQLNQLFRRRGGE